MIIPEPIHILESDLVVGLKFCTTGDSTKYTITKVIEDDFIFKCIITDEFENCFNAHVDGGYLYCDEYEARLDVVPYTNSNKCYSRSWVSESL